MFRSLFSLSGIFQPLNIDPMPMLCIEFVKFFSLSILFSFHFISSFVLWCSHHLCCCRSLAFIVGFFLCLIKFLCRLLLFSLPSQLHHSLNSIKFDLISIGRYFWLRAAVWKLVESVQETKMKFKYIKIWQIFQIGGIQLKFFFVWTRLSFTFPVV